MLWQVTKPPASGLYWLDEVHKNFYIELFDGKNFDDCFVDRFQPVLAASVKTKRLFQSVYNLYTALGLAEKIAFQALYQNHLSYQDCFDDTALPVLRPAPGYADLWVAVKKLGGYLYSTTIGLDCFADAAINDPSMDQHYEDYKALNGKVCCFCGTEEMMEERDIVPDEGNPENDEKQWRASYDHYLPKKHYPFLAVDFNNLVPCCQKCNEKAKGEKDLLENGGNRVLAFNPYQDTDGVRLIANYKCDGLKNIMSVEIEGTGCTLEDKGNTWNGTFLVLDRVNKRLNDFDSSWLAPSLNGCDNAETARNALGQEAARCNAVKTTEREGYFKSLCFSEVLTKSDEQISDLLLAVEQIYSGRTLA
ncbi:hypothetical protein [uncultured Pseudoteredinibacter sp.]|uniref:hypothetical protein n=1 Tax=uncultured Pseudoteredinibacter sp. TaxID=1641701 RepID=UPI00263A044F|nr:hypothetical protein [uncultured Pseudoteredinibacter sp.]